MLEMLPIEVKTFIARGGARTLNLEMNLCMPFSKVKVSRASQLCHPGEYVIYISSSQSLFTIQIVAPVCLGRLCIEACSGKELTVDHEGSDTILQGRDYTRSIMLLSELR